MPEMRIGKGWTVAELNERLGRLDEEPVSFAEVSLADMTPEEGWRAERYEELIAREPPGRPLEGGPFERARAALARYEVSDPAIVEGHFDPADPMVGRRMLLEIKVLGVHYLCGVLVTSVDAPDEDGATTAGFRYDTLRNHLERGAEWFVVVKDHATGDVKLRIYSRWRRGEFPNWWSRLGFGALAPIYRDMWLRRAGERMRRAAGQPELETPARDALLAAAALGAVSGARSLAGAAALAVDGSLVGPRPGASAIERVVTHPTTTFALAALAGAEMVADKHPGIPPRTSPPALIGRAIMGGAVGAAVATRARTAIAPAALAGAAAATAATFATRRARAALTRALGGRSALAGAIEDALVVGGALLARRLLAHPDPIAREPTEHIVASKAHPLAPVEPTVPPDEPPPATEPVRAPAEVRDPARR